MRPEIVTDYPIIPRTILTNEVHLHLLYDIHFGSGHCNYGLLDDAIAMIQADPKALFMLGGDSYEAISSADWRAWRSNGDHYRKGTRVDEMANAIGNIKRDLQDRLYPIKDKCVAVLKGNHELKWGSTSDLDLAAELAHHLGARYGDYECALVFRFQRGEVKSQGRAGNRSIYLWSGIASHGWGGGQQQGGQVNRQRLWADQFDGVRFTVRGHSHALTDVPVSRSKIIPGHSGQYYIKVEDRLDVQCGTFLDGAYYAKTMGLRRGLTGWKMISAKVHEDKKFRTKFISQKCETMPY